MEANKSSAPVNGYCQSAALPSGVSKNMKKIILIFSIILMSFLFGCSPPPIIPDLIDWESREPDRAEQVVQALAIGEYATVRENFDESMKSALSLKKLKKAWENMVDQGGAFISIIETEELPPEDYYIYLVESKHENNNVISRIVFNEEGFVSGLYFRFADAE